MILSVGVILILLHPGIVTAQSPGQTLSSSEVSNKLDMLYGLDQRLVSGSSYPGEALGSIIGHPYWIDSGWKKGRVVMDGVTFDNLLLKLDIESNDLVLNTSNLSNQSIQLCLQKERVSELVMDNRKFIKFPGEENNNFHFCEVCCEGQIIYIVTRNKTLAIASSGSADFKYKEYIKHYLLIDGEVIRFTGKRTLFNLFPDKKQELRRFINTNSISLSRKNTDDRSKLVEYFNSIIDNS